VSLVHRRSQVRIGNRRPTRAPSSAGPDAARLWTLLRELDFRCEARRCWPSMCLPLEEYLARCSTARCHAASPEPSRPSGRPALCPHAQDRRARFRSPITSARPFSRRFYAGVDHEDPKPVVPCRHAREVLAHAASPSSLLSFELRRQDRERRRGSRPDHELPRAGDLRCAGHSPYAHWSVTAGARFLDALGGRGVSGITVTSRSATDARALCACRARLERATCRHRLREALATSACPASGSSASNGMTRLRGAGPARGSLCNGGESWPTTARATGHPRPLLPRRSAEDLLKVGRTRNQRPVPARLQATHRSPVAPPPWTACPEAMDIASSGRQAVTPEPSRRRSSRRASRRARELLSQRFGALESSAF